MNRSEWEPGEKDAVNKRLQECPLYLCDPDKNTDCPKTSCALLYPGYGECRYTLNAKYAATDRYGKPVKVADKP